MDLKELQKKIADEKAKRQITFERITGVNSKKFLIVNDHFVHIKCENKAEVSAVLTGLKPFKNGWKITDGVYITSLYKITAKNDYYYRTLQIEFENNSGDIYWVQIDFKDLPVSFVEKYFNKGCRGLYDTETVYVNIPSHHKKFKDIRLESFTFKSQQVSFYGGNKVLTDEETIKNMIGDICD
jgi:hypothetical protein